MSISPIEAGRRLIATICQRVENHPNLRAPGLSHADQRRVNAWFKDRLLKDVGLLEDTSLFRGFWTCDVGGRVPSTPQKLRPITKPTKEDLLENARQERMSRALSDTYVEAMHTFGKNLLAAGHAKRSDFSPWLHHRTEVKTKEGLR